MKSIRGIYLQYNKCQLSRSFFVIIWSLLFLFLNIFEFALTFFFFPLKLGIRFYPPFKVFISESESEVAQSCPTLCNPMNYSLPGFSVHGIFQARILEWVATSFSRRSSQPRDQTWVSHIVARCFTI